MKEKTERYKPNAYEKRAILIGIVLTALFGIFSEILILSSPEGFPYPASFIIATSLIVLGWFLFAGLGGYWFLELHPEIKTKLNKMREDDRARHIKWLKPLRLDWIYNTDIMIRWHNSGIFKVEEKKESEKQ